MRQALATLLAAHWILIVSAVLAASLLLSAAARAATLTALRYAGQPLLLLAVVALVYDGTRTIAGGSGWVVTSLLEHWKTLAPASLEAARAAVGGRVPLLWDGLIAKILALPAWLTIGSLGIALSYLGRKRRKVDVFAN